MAYIISEEELFEKIGIAGDDVAEDDYFFALEEGISLSDDMNGTMASNANAWMSGKGFGGIVEVNSTYFNEDGELMYVVEDIG